MKDTVFLFVCLLGVYFLGPVHLISEFAIQTEAGVHCTCPERSGEFCTRFHVLGCFGEHIRQLKN